MQERHPDDRKCTRDAPRRIAAARPRLTRGAEAVPALLEDVVAVRRRGPLDVLVVLCRLHHRAPGPVAHEVEDAVRLLHRGGTLEAALQAQRARGIGEPAGRRVDTARFRDKSARRSETGAPAPERLISTRGRKAPRGISSGARRGGGASSIRYQPPLEDENVLPRTPPYPDPGARSPTARATSRAQRVLGGPQSASAPWPAHARWSRTQGIGRPGRGRPVAPAERRMRGAAGPGRGPLTCETSACPQCFISSVRATGAPVIERARARHAGTGET